MIIAERPLHMPGGEERAERLMDAYDGLMSAIRDSHGTALSDGEFWAALEYNFGGGIVRAYLSHLQEAGPA